MKAQAERLLHTTVESPIGELLLVGDDEALHGLYIKQGRRPVRVEDSWQSAEQPFDAAREQLGEYFAGERAEFELTLAPGRDALPAPGLGGAERDSLRGDDQLRRARARGSAGPAASRAVGMANGRNPISIVVPCHRVIGADGTLTGYGGGIERKRFLLELEAGRPSLVL